MIRVVLDCIVHPKFKNEGSLLHKFSALSSFATALSSKCHFLIITNEKQSDVEITGSAEIYFLQQPANLLSQLQLMYRIKQKIKRWKTDVVVHSGSLPYQKQKHNVLLVKSGDELTAFSVKKIKQTKLFFATTTFVQQQLIHNHHISAEKIIVTPFPVNAACKVISWEEKETIKSTYSKGAEFFLYNHLPASDPGFVQLLRAFSIFKKRLQTNMKLLIPCSMLSTNKKYSQLLKTYKFKEDLLFTGNITGDETAKLTAAAYAVIHCAEKESFFQAQDIVQYKIPVLILQPDHWIKEQLCFEYANIQSSNDIAAKLMLLYKNETHRNKLINTSQELLPQFSAETTVKTFHKALLCAASE